jgi:hypothetical protein
MVPKRSVAKIKTQREFRNTILFVCHNTTSTKIEISILGGPSLEALL